MNDILKKTHKKSNTEILKARDYYFNISKSLNLLKTLIVLLPPSLLLASYLLSMLQFEPIPLDYIELATGLLAAIVAFSVYVIDYFIQKYTDISNQLRELYDHYVLGTKYNDFLYNAKDVQKHIAKSRKVKDSTKYEVWYSEVFSDNHYANVFCCQIDNLLYAKHAYAKTKKLYCIVMAICSILIFAAILLSVINKAFVTTFLIIFSALECYDVYLNKISALSEALDVCTKFCHSVKEIDVLDLNQTIIDQLQEIVKKNRELCIFLPRTIRDQFLEDDNPFYKELNNYKSLFLGNSAAIPEDAVDIDVVFEDGSNAVPLCDIQARLAVMLKKVVSVLDEAGIIYTLDGGTLIGAMRPSAQGFIPWDDDIDIAIPINQIEKAKAILRERLNYIIQDAENEPFYSPRLSTFKIREPNSMSMVLEKDSTLCQHYQNKGLFIDVYAFSPILSSKAIDKVFRRLIIHPLNRRLEKIENSIFFRNNHKLQFSLFFKLKKQYMRILSFYSKHAKNTKMYAFYPGYVYNYSKPGPYHNRADLYGNSHNLALWESDFYNIPANPDSILQAYYGNDWAIPPFRRKDDLIADYGKQWFSKAPSKITALKHISYMLHYNRQ